MRLGITRLVVVLSTACFASGCAAGAARYGGATQDVTIAVRNPSGSGALVRVCAPAGCLPVRAVAGGEEAEFRFSSERGTRAVVTAKRGDRVLDQQPVDFRRGGRYQVVLDLP